MVLKREVEQVELIVLIEGNLSQQEVFPNKA